jgi:hypothetical protein
MGKVLFGLSVSLDGFIADPHGDPSQVFAWMGKAMQQLHEVVGDTFHLRHREPPISRSAW